MTSLAQSIRVTALGLHLARRTSATVPEAILGVLFAVAVVATLTRALDQTALWENLHWTLAGLLSVVITRRAVQRCEPRDRPLRLLFHTGFVLWLLGQVAWDVQAAVGYVRVPAPSDLLYLACSVPVVVALVRSVHGFVSKGEQTSAYLDSATAFFALTAVILWLVGERAGASAAALAVTALYPIVYLATSAAGLIASVSVGAHRSTPRNLLFLAAFGAHGVAWLVWMNDAVISAPPPGSAVNYAFSFTLLGAALAAARWQRPQPAADGLALDRVSSAVVMLVPVPAIVASLAVLVIGRDAGPFRAFEQAAAVLSVLVAVVRQTLLLRERSGFVGRERAQLNAQRRLLSINEALLTTSSAQSVLDSIADTLAGVVPYDTLTIYLVDDDRRGLTPVLARDRWAPQILESHVAWGQGITGYAVAHGEATLVNDASSDPRASQVPGTPNDKEALIVAPLIGPDGVLGALNLYREGREFEPAELDLARLYASQAAIALETARRHGALAAAARLDPLTNLLNRTAFRAAVEAALATQPSNRSTAVLFLDLDGFKLVNDSLGHAAGDEVLRNVAQRLRHSLRPEDEVARLGGDEFAVLVSLASDRDATVVADRLLTALRSPFRLVSTDVSVRTSIGITTSALSIDVDALLRDADVAMYEAKAAGKDRYEYFRPEFHERALARLELERDLRRALERDEFELHYQPLVDLVTVAVVGYEALVRWRHPTDGLLLPAAFLREAEESGLIRPLGRWVLRAALRQAAEWWQSGWRGVVSVNVAPQQLAEPGLVALIEADLARLGLTSAALQLEITESAALGDDAQTRHTIDDIAASGVAIVLDDFGTRYSSLQRVAELPLAGLKVDRTFVAGLGHDRTRTAIVDASIAFGHALGLRVTAEGIETPEQRRRLAELGCDLGQGYLLGRPSPTPTLSAATPTLRLLKAEPA